MKRFQICDRSETDYPECFGIVSKGGQLYVVPLGYTIRDYRPNYMDVHWDGLEEALELELIDETGFEAIGVGVFTHCAYSHPSKEDYVNFILDEVSRITGIPFATA